MPGRHLVSAGALVVALAGALVAVVPVAGQAPGAAAARFTPPPSPYSPPRTPWGDPDLQGVFDYQTVVPMQRPPELAGKTSFTEAEFAAFEEARLHAGSFDRCGFGTRKNEKCTPEQLKAFGAYNEFWDVRVIVKDLRTSLIVDPPNGRFPPMLADADARQKAHLAKRAIVNDRPPKYNSWEELPSIVRCVATPTPTAPMGYNNGTYIMQSPGWVLIVQERLNTRAIPLDGRPHISPTVRQWNGHSVGRWEGNTLVVDTTNLTDEQVEGGVGASIPAGIPLGNVHLIERFVPVSPTRIHYYATIEDPKLWTRPWTFMVPWEKQTDYTILEYACHEGNLSVGGTIRGARIQEAEEAAGKGN